LTCVYNLRQVLAFGKSGAGLPLHRSEKTENYCSVTAIFFTSIFGETSKQDFSSYTLYVFHSILYAQEKDFNCSHFCVGLNCDFLMRYKSAHSLIIYRKYFGTVYDNY
jgi:hypothetical protein